MSSFSPAQLAALASIREALAPVRWVLIGACAIRARVPLSRTTADVDLAVIADGDAILPRLSEAGWLRDPKKTQTWRRGSVSVDVVCTTEEQMLEGVVQVDGGWELSVVGFDLAFAHSSAVPIADDQTVDAPTLAPLVLLKMVAWLDRPHERAKDLGDISQLLLNALDEDDELRWDTTHPVGQSGLHFEEQSPFFAGWQLGSIADTAHLHVAKRFLDCLREDESTAFAALVRSANMRLEDTETRLRGMLTAFEHGLELGARRKPEIAVGSPFERSPATFFSWGRSGATEMRIHDAILARRVVKFVYRNQLRIVQPLILGTKGGRLQILTMQVGGGSSSGLVEGPFSNWRRFFVDELSGFETTDQTFAAPPRRRGRDDSFDRYIAVAR